MTLVRMESDYIDDYCYTEVFDFREVPDESHGAAIDVDPATLDRWKKAAAEWGACQDDMEAAKRHQTQRHMDRTERGTRIIPRWPA